MVKVSRNYQHQDFSDLLKELNTPKHIAKKQNFRYKIIMVSRYPNTNCIDVICRIPRWKKQKFQNILDQIKDCCVDGQQYDFADFCHEKIR